MSSSLRTTWANSSGSLDSQPACGWRRMRPPLAPPRLSLPRNEDAAFHAVDTSCGTVSPEARIASFNSATSASLSWLCPVGTMSPQQRLLGNQRADVAGNRAHVTVDQLEPRLANSSASSAGWSSQRRVISP